MEAGRIYKNHPEKDEILSEVKRQMGGLRKVKSSESISEANAVIEAAMNRHRLPFVGYHFIVRGSGTSEGVKKSWEHRTRSQALAQLKTLRSQGFKGRVSVEKDPRKGVYFLRKQEGTLAERKQQVEVTPYDKAIRRMKKYGTSDMHGALADEIYSDKKARSEFEGDNPEASWEDAAGDLAANYLSMYEDHHEGK